MMRYVYPYVVEPDSNGSAFISFPDVPEALTGAEPSMLAATAQDALVTALSFYTDDSRRLPKPSPAHSRPVVVLPVLIALKLALHDAMLDAGLSNVALAQRLGVDEKMVRRLRDPLHRTKVEALEAALGALGCHAEVHVMGHAA